MHQSDCNFTPRKVLKGTFDRFYTSSQLIVTKNVALPVKPLLFWWSFPDSQDVWSLKDMGIHQAGSL